MCGRGAAAPVPLGSSSPIVHPEGQGSLTVLRLPLSFLCSTKQLELWFSSLQEDAGQTPGGQGGVPVWEGGREGGAVCVSGPGDNRAPLIPRLHFYDSVLHTFSASPCPTVGDTQFLPGTPEWCLSTSSFFPRLLGSPVPGPPAPGPPFAVLPPPCPLRIARSSLGPCWVGLQGSAPTPLLQGGSPNFP